MKEKKKLKVKEGLHFRPAAEIVQALKNIVSSVTLTYKKQSANAKSILSILMLAIQKNSSVNIDADGVDAKEAIHKIEEIISSSTDHKT